jgi:hypothetical protein
VAPFTSYPALEEMVSIIIYRLSTNALGWAKQIERGPEPNLNGNLELLV